MRITGEPGEVAPNRTDVRDGVGYYFPERSALATNALGNSTIFNLYTLRGDRYRDPADFIAAHDWALAKNAEVLADIHAPGIKGRGSLPNQCPNIRMHLTHLIHNLGLQTGRSPYTG